MADALITAPSASASSSAEPGGWALADWSLTDWSLVGGLEVVAGQRFGIGGDGPHPPERPR